VTWLYIVGVTIIACAIVWAEWRELENSGKKERSALLAIAALAWLAAVLVLLFPNMPGPVELLNFICKPLTDGLK